MRRPPASALRPVNRLNAAPTPNSAMPAVIAAIVTDSLQRQSEQERHQRDDRAERERQERIDRGAPRRAEVVRVEAQLLARERVERVRLVLHQFAAHAARLFELHAARLVDQREFFGFFFRVFVQLVALEPDLVLEHLALRAHRHVFARGHRERAGEQSRDAARQHEVRARRRTRDAHDQAGVRDEAVVDAEHRGAQVAAAVALVPRADVRHRGRHQVTRERALRIVGREAAHLHRGEHVAHAPRAERARERCGDARTHATARRRAAQAVRHWPATCRPGNRRRRRARGTAPRSSRRVRTTRARDRATRTAFLRASCRASSWAGRPAASSEPCAPPPCPRISFCTCFRMATLTYGFSMKSVAPSRIAATAVGTSDSSASRMTGTSLPLLRSRRSSSRPDMPGSSRSTIRQARLPRRARQQVGLRTVEAASRRRPRAAAASSAPRARPGRSR